MRVHASGSSCCHTKYSNVQTNQSGNKQTTPQLIAIATKQHVLGERPAKTIACQNFTPKKTSTNHCLSVFVSFGMQVAELEFVLILHVVFFEEIV